jgi:phosphatidylinositol 4-kinase
MVVLVGGRNSQGHYALFQQLFLATFLALRPHAPQLIATVRLMLGTGLSSFKGRFTGCATASHSGSVNARLLIL